MKKLISVLLAFVLVIPVLFGEVVDTHDFEISTTIDPVAAIKVFAATTEPTVENWDTLTALPKYVFEDGVIEAQFYVAAKTNYNKNLTINVDAPHMTRVGGGDTHIGYQIESISSTAITQKQELAKETLSAFSMRVISVAATVALSEAEYDAAVVGTYKATLVFELVSD